MKKYHIFRDTERELVVLATPKENFSTADLFTQKSPLLLATDAEIPRDFQQKDVKIVFINAEKYTDPSTLSEMYSQDLYESFYYKTTKKYALAKANVARKHTLIKGVFATILALLLLAVAFIAGATAYHYTKIPALFYATGSFAFISGGLAIVMYYRFKKPEPPALSKLYKLLLRNKREQKAIVIEYAERLNMDCQIQLFKTLSSLLKFNPLYTVISTAPSVVNHFKNYFVLDTMNIEINAPVLSHTSQSQTVDQVAMPLKPQVNGIETIPQVQEIIEQKASQLEAEYNFDFENATPKAIINAIKEKELTSMSPCVLLEKALPKIAKMTEKTIAEYIAVLSHTIKEANLLEFNLLTLDSKTLQKLLTYFKAENSLDIVMPLYTSALNQKNYLALSVFATYIADKTLLTDFIISEFETAFTEDMLPLISAMSQELTPFFTMLMEDTKNPLALCKALVETGDKLDEVGTQKVYQFIMQTLKLVKDSDELKIIMQLISKLKDKFRFVGLSTASFNDIIFSKEFSSANEKIEYIESLLSLSTLSDDEKNRYVSFLTHSAEDLTPNDKARVMETLIKSGVNISKESLLSCVKAYEDDRSEEYLDTVVSLLHSYFAKSKDESIFIDIACHFMDEADRATILSAALKVSPAASAKITKAMLTKLCDEGELFLEMRYYSVALASLGGFCEHAKFPKNEFIEGICQLLEYQTSVKKFVLILELLIKKYDKIMLNGDQKHDLKSSMFRGAAKFNDDLSIITSAILKAFKIEYISFNEQRIAKQGDSDVAIAADELLAKLKLAAS